MDCLKEVATTLGLDEKWVNIGALTKQGHPRHPLYLAANSKLNDFDIKTYLIK